MTSLFSSLPSCPKELLITIHVHIPNMEDAHLPAGFELPLGDVEVLEPELERDAFKGLTELSLEILCFWPSVFENKLDVPRSRLSSSALHEVLRKKLPKYSARGRIYAVVRHTSL